MISSEPEILIVDDEPDILKLFETFLEDQGSIQCSTNGEEALKIVSRRRPDVILMDVKFPYGVDGLKIASIIKNLYNIPSVIVTGNSINETYDQSEQFFNYILKPVSHPQVLKMAVLSALRAIKAESQSKFSFGVDADGLLLSLSKNGRELLGIDDGGVFLKSVKDVFVPIDNSEEFFSNCSSLTGGRWDSRIRVASGKTVECEIETEAVTLNGSLLGYSNRVHIVDEDAIWQTQNRKRLRLIRKKVISGLDELEQEELDGLQLVARRYIDKLEKFDERLFVGLQKS